MRRHCLQSIILISIFSFLLISAGDKPSPEGQQKLFDLSAIQTKLAVERELIGKL